MVTALPRVIIAAPGSGHGKTTVATGIMAALSNFQQNFHANKPPKNLVVSGHKVGPDYIDPGYHALATGRPGRNLDPHLVGEDLIVPLLLHGAAGADLAVIEGVMGLFDGQIGGRGFSSTAHIAQLTRTPIILVIDISHTSRTIAAIVQGIITFQPELQFGGVILNKAGSARHAKEVNDALEEVGIPVLGTLYRDDAIAAPSRHLGLIPAAERADAQESLTVLATKIAAAVDLSKIIAIALQASPLSEVPWEPSNDIICRSSKSPVIAVAGGRAFTFRYTETLEMLTAGGCSVVEFDPLIDSALPANTAGLYLGGGFPEVHVAELSANTFLRAAIKKAVAEGLPTVAECAGLLYLGQELDSAPMVGALPITAEMTPKLSLSYAELISPTDTLLAQAGSRVHAHEFHRTTTSPLASDTPAWLHNGVPQGFSSATLHASYHHLHWAGFPLGAQRFIDAADKFSRTHNMSSSNG